MATNDIRTSHDLAEALEVAARALRDFPEMSLHELSHALTRSQPHKAVVARDKKPSDEFQLADLSRRFSGLGRSEAEAELKNLKADAIRQLAASLGIRMPSKLTKAEATSMLLSQVFDIPAGHELLRTFHRRHSTP